MAAITKRLLCLRSNLNPYLRSCPYAIHRHCSSSFEPPPATPEPEFVSESESPQQNRHQKPRKPFSFFNTTSPESPRSKIDPSYEIRTKPSKFLRRSAAPPPFSSSACGQPVSFIELLKKGAILNTGGSDSPAAKPLSPTERFVKLREIENTESKASIEGLTFKDFRENLLNLKKSVDEKNTRLYQDLRLLMAY